MVVKQLWTLNSFRALHQTEANLKSVALGRGRADGEIAEQLSGALQR